jgi:RNA polymerase sigma-B factor
VTTEIAWPDDLGEDDRGDSNNSDDYVDVDHLFARLENACSDEERRFWRERIVTKALPLADHIASRFVGRGESRDDLVQVARLALVKAVERYERDKGQFVSFAVPTIFGEIRRHFRDNTWGMHVPRSCQEASLAVRGAVSEMSQRMGRMPTTTEIADELHMSLDEIRRSQMAAKAYRPSSLDAPVTGADGEAQPLAALHGEVDHRYDKVEDLIVLADLVRELPERERVILRMRFYDCLKQRDIALCLGISQVHVSRLLSATLERLRIMMCAEGAALLPVLAVIATQITC